MKVLVCGGAGYIGSHMVWLLLVQHLIPILLITQVLQSLSLTQMALQVTLLVFTLREKILMATLTTVVHLLFRNSLILKSLDNIQELNWYS